MQSAKELTPKTDAQKLADEIYHVYEEVRMIIPDVHKRIGRADPAWIFLEPEKSGATAKQATMRDYILRQYAAGQDLSKQSVIQIKQKAIACPLSFDITSNPAVFDIDHFHSRADLMAKLEELEQNQVLLGEVKARLLEKGLSHRVLNKMIPTSRDKLKVTGLKNLYYNYPKNLWPLSGPVNSQKQDQSPLSYAAEMTFSALHTYAQEERFSSFLGNIEEEFDIEQAEVILNEAQREKALSQRLTDVFDETVQNPSILPYMVDEDEYLVCELAFFKRTILGQTAENYCNARAELTVKSMEITNRCLKNTPEYRNGVKAIFKCMNKAISGEESSISSDDIDAPNLSFMSATQEHLVHTIQKQKRKLEPRSTASSLTSSPSEEQKQPSASSTKSPSLFAEKTKNMRQKLRQQKHQVEQGEIDDHKPKKQKPI